jgi:hypothetical protein
MRAEARFGLGEGERRAPPKVETGLGTRPPKAADRAGRRSRPQGIGLARPPLCQEFRPLVGWLLPDQPPAATPVVNADHMQETVGWVAEPADRRFP